MSRRTAALLLLVALAAGACGTDDGDEVPASATVTTAVATTVATGDGEETTTSSTAVAAAHQTCRNDADAYTARYPRDWHVNDPDPDLGACRFFHPKPFTVPKQTEATEIAISISAERAEVDEAAPREDTEFERVRKREDRTVDGRPAVRLKTEATGQGLYDAGTREVRWVVDRGEDILILTTTSAADADFAESVEVLDGIAASLDVG
jgi:hypothetical protein